MFFLTKKILRKIIKRKNLNDDAIEQPFNLEEKPVMDLLHNTIIVQISSICFFPEENILAIELYDGSKENCSAFIDQSKWNSVMRKHFESDLENDFITDAINSSQNLITIGSVLILKEYTFENIITLEYIEDRDEKYDYYIQDCLKIIDFLLIGHNENYKSYLKTIGF